VLSIILRPLAGPAARGEPVTCGDGIERIIYPGIAIASLDNEEACTYCGCRSSLANYPCPRCLVHNDDLHRLTEMFTPRTPTAMRAVFNEVKEITSRAKREEILRDHGLNFVQVSPPNRVISTYRPITARMRYGNSVTLIRTWHIHMIHFILTTGANGVGTSGHYYWTFSESIAIKDAWLRSECIKLLTVQTCPVYSRHTGSMNSVPRWRNLKHFPNVTTVEYTDGQAFLDILKVSTFVELILYLPGSIPKLSIQCILPCVVQLLPRNSPLVQCIRAYAQTRMMIGLHCISELQISRLRVYIKKYQDFCTVCMESQIYCRSYSNDGR
jgi:hypothetical protein